MGAKNAIKASVRLAAVLVISLFQVAVHAKDVEPVSFTAAQAERGRALFDTACAGCHGSTLQGGPGGPPLVGTAFRGRWQSQSGDALFTFIRSKMPPNKPGSLGNAGYADALAYLLKTNGATSSNTPLPDDPAILSQLSLGKALPTLAPNSFEIPPPLSVNTEPDAITREALQHRAQRLATLRQVTDEMLRSPPPEDWLHWRNTYDAHGFSQLTQINRRNVAGLKVGWVWELPPGSNEITPLVHDGVMFIANGQRLQALDAASGDLLWEYVDSTPAHSAPIGPPRSLAIYADRIFFATKQRMVALNMRTGAVLWEHSIALPADPIDFSGGPLVAKGKIIQGITGCAAPYPGGCFIVALDPDTGQEIWRFNSIARPGQPGGDTWNGASIDDRFGGSVWTPGSYNPELDLLYFGTGQTYKVSTLLLDANGKSSLAAGLFTDTTLAIRPETGKLEWYFQHLPGDVWDLDWAFERTLSTLYINGKARPTVTTSGKLAIFDTLDAETGRYLFSADAGLQNLISLIDPKSGEKTIDPKFAPEPGVTKIICPSSLGGRDWPSTAFNPRTHIIYVPLNDACMPYRWTPGSNFDISLLPIIARPNSDGMIGRLQAIDLDAHKTLWIRRQRASQSSSVLATAAGLIFEGSRDRWFRASDDRTGRVLWRTRLNGSPSSSPITYSSGGTQYVAVTTGVGDHTPTDVLMGALTPEIETPSGGTTLWVFRLPERR